MAKLSIFGVFLLGFAISIAPVDAANILGLFTSHSPSHLIIHMSVVKALAEQGHNVTVVTSIPLKVTHKSIHHIMIPPTPEQLQTIDAEISSMASEKNNFFRTLFRMFGTFNVMIEHQYEALLNDKFKPIYDTKFDLVIWGYFFNDFQLGVAGKLRCPIIVDWMQMSMEVTDKYIGNPRELSYVPQIATSFKPGQKIGFVKRVENLFKNWTLQLLVKLIDYNSQKKFDKLFSKASSVPTLEELKRNVSLIFTSSHSPSEGPIRPLVPASVEIGGIQIKEKPDPLPKDIVEFIDNAKNGAILLSLGSNVKSTNIKPEIIKTMYGVLSTLKQRVIWKWEDLSSTPGNSSNILFKKWLPQDDILAHPNIKLFITHAGKGGITEAQYHGVPMLALPIFGDQNSNADRMTESGYGLSLELLKLNEKQFKDSISEIITNPKYTKAVKRFSQLYRDRPLTAKQAVVYWTEYVLRHHGAPHLQSPAVHMNAIEYYNLDIFALLITLSLLVLVLAKKALSFIYRKLTVKTAASKPKNKKLKKK